MESNVIKLHDEVAKVEKQLNKLVDSGEEYDKLYNQSVVVDQVIAKYLRAKQHLENERKMIIDKYQNKLNTSYREEIVSSIESDVKAQYPDAKEIEIEHFSNNVYIYTTLSANNIDKNEIIEQLMYLNNVYFEEMQEDGRVKNSKIDSNNLKYLEDLNKKYLKIIKERM